MSPVQKVFIFKLMKIYDPQAIQRVSNRLYPTSGSTTRGARVRKFQNVKDPFAADCMHWQFIIGKIILFSQHFLMVFTDFPIDNA